ncbi:PREDICTED: probable mannan synthase 11 [Erythranthe guttata]|uniref:probable mannan synthase 11 n=1 Tax=Erythranthe guttata TaxID=4155 RepID=UPI00064DECC9|nr:PREDICTED: probable mannan synthase 11 [Erythranthe guttata]|eukprot:XP_012837984.1 PREDICTED: probable mannan synthase 11 [Erythranthe guttata]
MENGNQSSIPCSLIFCEGKMAEISAKAVVLEWVVGSTADIRARISPVVALIRANVVVPCLRVALYTCLVLSFLLFLEWVHVMFLAAVAKLFRKKPAERYKWEPMANAAAGDLENGGNGKDCFPIVLVQIPIFNEIEVYKMSIGAACRLSWPSDRLVVQVLDDSTDLTIKDMIEKECMRWSSEGINIRYQVREGRVGYKAGALKEGLKRDYVKECEFVAIFDADFQPEPDFLRRSIPFFTYNPEIGLIQARWRFVNANECFLTRMQEMSLDYQFVIEQEGGSSIHAFFSFNGSGGIWRIAAIEEAGGWKDRTTVEDMDLAVRAGLKGWKFLFLGDLDVKSELPSTFKAYRSQQHRWACGPANLFRKMATEIAKNKEVSIWKKLYMIYNFFFIRKLVGTMFTFFFYCVVLPLVSLMPEVDVTKWGAILATFVIATINTLVATPRSTHLAVPWVLFENIMSFHRTKGIFIGLFEAKRANEWVVTEKRGDALKNKPNVESCAPKKPPRFKLFRDRILLQELGIATFLYACGLYGVFYGDDKYYIYLFPQAIFFTVAGFGYYGTMIAAPISYVS